MEKTSEHQALLQSALQATSQTDKYGHESENEWVLAFCYDYDHSEDMAPEYVEANSERKKVAALLAHAGLKLMHFITENRILGFIVVGSSQQLLETEAEKMRLRLPLKSTLKKFDSRHPMTDIPGSIDTRDVCFSVYTQAQKNNFVEFDSLIKQRILESKITSPTTKGGLNIDLEKLITDKVFTDIFPLHNEIERDNLVSKWMKSHKWWELHKMTLIPSWELRNYLGEKASFYFVWLAHYTKWLIPLSVIGIISTIIQFSAGKDKNPFLYVYGILLCFWCDALILTWKRKQNELRFVWDVRDFELVEKPRREFWGREEAGIYTTGGFFVRLEPSLLTDLIGEDSKEMFFSVKERMIRQAIGVPIIVTFLICTIAGTLGILALRNIDRFQEMDSQWPSIICGCLNAVFITVMNIVYAIIAEKLNSFENHRTATQHEDALIIKTFLFQFVNSYISLFYIAFIKKDPSQDAKEMRILGLHAGVCQDSCMDELFYQLATLVIAKQFVSNFVEVGIPFLKSKFKAHVRGLNMTRVGDGGGGISTGIQKSVMKEHSHPKFLGTFTEYNEMMIQFGYVTLFAAAFPLASVASYINNVLEIRTDALKILFGCQRPWYQADNDIGTWSHVLSSMSIIAVITNGFIIAFTSNILRGTTQEDGTCDGPCLDTLSRLTIVLIFEHLILFVKVLSSVLVGDTPEWVHQQLAKQLMKESGYKRKRSSVGQALLLDTDFSQTSLTSICEKSSV
eukprot:c20694_g1_i1.p1 GENE.c20694_g1_i1~~c20694_g1_i1.p1  ORF type:complete len:749 (+),score=243.26 c20694_g1_i1:36-2249(+)